MSGLDDYTMEMRLCDDAGLVSEQPVTGMGPRGGETYLERLNRLRSLTARMTGNRHEPVSESFVCTGSAHLAGEHIRCTSPAHRGEQ